MTTKAYKVSISGSYRSGSGARAEYVDFEGIEGIVPFTDDEEYAEAMIRRRYAPMWLAKSPKYKKTVTTVREVYIDTLKVVDHDFTVIGKDIRDLTYEELQDLAVLKRLRGIPLYKKGGIVQARQTAYGLYSKHVFGVDIQYRESSFRLAEAEPIIVDDLVEDYNPKAKDIEETLNNERVSIGLEGMSRKNLETAARQKGIRFNPAIKDEALYKRVYGDVA